MGADQNKENLLETCIRLFSEELLKGIMGVVIAFVIGFFIVVPGIEFFGVSIPMPTNVRVSDESSNKKQEKRDFNFHIDDEVKTQINTMSKIDKADSYFNKGGANNMNEAFKIYKGLADTSPDEFKSVDNFKYVCRQVAKCYRNGWGTQRDEPKALYYDERAMLAQ